MFEQMMLDCAREGSFGELDNALMAKDLLHSLLEAFGRYNAAEVRAICAVALGISSFMHRPVKSKKVRACEEISANDPGSWILKRETG